MNANKKIKQSEVIKMLSLEWKNLIPLQKEAYSLQAQQLTKQKNIQSQLLGLQIKQVGELKQVGGNKRVNTASDQTLT